MTNMTSEKRQISSAENEILEILWEASPLTASEIIDEVNKFKVVHANTVKTLLARLVKKSAVSYKEKNRKYLYSPLLKKSDFYQQETNKFLQRFFSGNISSLLSHFADNSQISEKDIQELKQLIKKLEEEND